MALRIPLLLKLETCIFIAVVEISIKRSLHQHGTQLILRWWGPNIYNIRLFPLLFVIFI